MHLAVVGGGFSGLTTAVQVARHAPHPCRITIIEPAAALGRGLAYGTTDPDHRLNGPLSAHSIDPLDIGHLEAWAVRTDLELADPEARAPTGLFIRRRDYARYLHETCHAHASSNSSGSSIRHLRRTVVDLTARGGGWTVCLDDQTTLTADQVVLAPGNPPPRLPAELRPWSGHPALIPEPLRPAGLPELCPDARVMILGSSLTAADVLATLVRRCHRGPITVFSRRGLRPRPQRPPDPPTDTALPATWVLDRINGPVPAGIGAAVAAGDVLALSRAVRREVAAGVRRGEPWQQAFDSVRDVVWQIWPALTLTGQRRFLRHLRPWYDVHRFRMAPPTAALIEPAVASGQIRFVAARLAGVRAGGSSGSEYLQVRLAESAGLARECRTDVLVNCAGLDLASPPRPGSLAARLLAGGLLDPHPNGVGYRVGADNTVLGPDGRVSPGLRLVGPLTAGCFGDPLGAMFIAVQCHRMLPALFADRSNP